jgi:hypothetical protein
LPTASRRAVLVVTDSALMEFMEEFEPCVCRCPTRTWNAQEPLCSDSAAQTVGEIAGKLEEMVIYDLQMRTSQTTLAVFCRDKGTRALRGPSDPATVVVVACGRSHPLRRT